MSNKFRLVDKVLAAVPVADEFVRQFAMFSLGVFPPRRVLPQLLATFVERVWKVLNIHDEFSDLKVREKNDIFRKNCQAGMALMFVRNDKMVSLT